MLCQNLLISFPHAINIQHFFIHTTASARDWKPRTPSIIPKYDNKQCNAVLIFDSMMYYLPKRRNLYYIAINHACYYSFILFMRQQKFKLIYHFFLRHSPKLWIFIVWESRFYDIIAGYNEARLRCSEMH